MIEGVLILLSFLILFIGVADIGQILFIHQTLVERARSAARAGAVNNYDDATIQNLVMYGQTTAPQDTQGLFGLTAANIAIARPDAGTTAQRLVLTVSGLSYTSYSPLIAATLQNIPVTITVSMESPD